MIRSDVAWVHDGAHGLQHDTLIVDAEEAAEALFRTSCRDLVQLFRPLSEADLKPSDKVDAAFSCQGTNRKVDLEYMTKFTEGSKAAGVLYMDRLRSQGANKDS
ncbi:hypothetical protein PC111_g16651 [Phytophthora cactorum]|nr:hypothetical protein PC111_g16651 [Phytophthora cactorum]KAG3143867.1 hypothetical protein C6341_g18928 [Phytophthora cactorum]